MIVLRNKKTGTRGYALDPDTKQPIAKVVAFQMGANQTNYVWVWTPPNPHNMSKWDMSNVEIIGEDGREYFRTKPRRRL